MLATGVGGVSRSTDRGMVVSLDLGLTWDFATWRWLGCHGRLGWTPSSGLRARVFLSRPTYVATGVVYVRSYREMKHETFMPPCLILSVQVACPDQHCAFHQSFAASLNSVPAAFIAFKPAIVAPLAGCGVLVGLP